MAAIICLCELREPSSALAMVGVAYIGDYMNKRDREYIINRLTVPAPPLVEAMERLRKNGNDAEYKQLQEAYLTFMTTVRTVRGQL